MLYRILGSTGLKVSVIGVGTWQLGGEWGKTFDHDEVAAMFARAGDLGVNLVDTAECYGDHEAELLIGSALEGRRDEWILATKFGHQFHGSFDRTEPREPADVRAQVEASLRALRTDRVDLLQYHSWGDADFFRDDVLGAIGQLIDEGKVLHLGNSISKNDNVKQASASAGRGVEVLQVIYNRLDENPAGDDGIFEVAVRQNLGVLARLPLASGFLSGKYRPGHAFADPARNRFEAAERDRQLAAALKVQAEEVPEGVDLAPWSLAWCLRHPAVTAVIPGAKSVGQIESNAGAAGLVEQPRLHPQAA